MQVQNEIRTELEQLGSSLASLPKLMPYAVPEGYFEQLPVQVISSLAEENTIAALPKNNPFEIPVNYFEGLSNEVLKKAKGEKAAKKTIWLGGAIRWAAAAILLLGAGLGIMQLNEPSVPTFDQQMSALPEEAVQEYMAQTGEGTELLTGSLAMTDIPVHELSDEEIQQYLEETNF